MAPPQEGLLEQRSRFSPNDEGNVMALYMFMAKYTTQAIRDIVATGSDRESAANAAIEAAGGKLLGFYGMFGQEYNIAIIADMPGNAEYIAAVGSAIGSGALDSYKSIPLYTPAEVLKAAKIAINVSKAYTPRGS